MKRLIPIAIPLAAASLVAAAVLFHPAAAPGSAPAAGGWSTAPPAAAPAPRRTAAARAVVYVAGAVVRPGVYSLAADARAGDALARAGGARPDADLVAVNLAARLRDGDEIAVPVRGAVSPPRPRRGSAMRPRHGSATHGGTRGRAGDAGPGRRGGRRRGQRVDDLPPEVVDLNTADAAALQTLPGVGPALAARILAFRELNGPFGSTDELLDVAGVTNHRLDLISPYVTVR